MPMRSIDPSTEETIAEYTETDQADVENRLSMANDAFRRWQSTSMLQRSELMHTLAETLRREQEELATLMTREMGKPITQARGEIEKCAWVCDYFADTAERFLSPREIETDASSSRVQYDPLGPILAIMPWNFPHWQLFRCAAPAIMAGNVVVLKHASNVCGTALAIESLFVTAGFPVGTMTTLLLNNERAQQLIEHPLIRAVTLTGSVRAGRSVGGAAGKSLKKSVLELGGSDPFIVLADADISAAARAAAQSRTINSGQSCIAAKRFIVEPEIADEFVDAMRAELESMRVGNPLEDDTEIGPLARGDLLEALQDQVKRSLDAGAKLRAGGEQIKQKGYFYQPVILDNVSPGIPAFDEETFGPVAAIVRASDRHDAIALANQTQFGLGASLWTTDREMGSQLAKEIEAGGVFVNGIVKSDPRLPFGGIKASGYGRELSEEGIREFVNTKTVWIN